MSYEKVSNAILPLGGMSGAIIRATIDFHSMLSVIIYAAVGAIVGYFIKIGLDKLMEYIKQK